MDEKRKKARMELKSATRKEFENMIFEAMLTEMQEKILRLHLRRQKSICAISQELSFSETYVRRQLMQAYERIARI